MTARYNIFCFCFFFTKNTEWDFPPCLPVLINTTDKTHTLTHTLKDCSHFQIFKIIFCERFCVKDLTSHGSFFFFFFGRKYKKNKRETFEKTFRFLSCTYLKSSAGTVDVLHAAISKQYSLVGFNKRDYVKPAIYRFLRSDVDRNYLLYIFIQMLCFNILFGMHMNYSKQ